MIAPLLAASLAAAGPVKNADTLIMAEPGSFDSLDPAWTDDAPTLAVLLNVYEGLVGFSEEPGGLTPLLSERVPSIDNGLVRDEGRTYRFPIRRGVRFHDGSELTPEDVRYSLMRFMLVDRPGGPSSFLLEPLLGLSSTRDEKGALRPGLAAAAAAAVGVEDGAVVLRLKRPFAPLLQALATFGLVVPKRWAAARGDWDGTEADLKRINNPPPGSTPLHREADGTGPFRVERSEPGQVLLARHDGYWRGPARLKRVVLKNVPEFGTRKLMLLAGDVDVAFAHVVEASQLAGAPDVEVLAGLQTPIRNPIVFFNRRVRTVDSPYVGSGKLDGAGVPPDFFADRDVREGFARLIDHETYVRDILRGHGRPARGFIPPGVAGYAREGLLRPFDPAKAAALLKRAYGGRLWETGFKLIVPVNEGSAWRGTLAKMIGDALRAANPRFELQTRTVSWPKLLDDGAAGRIPLYLQGIQPAYLDPHAFAKSLVHSRGSFAPFHGHASPELDALVDRALAEADSKRRERLYAQLQRAVFDDVVFVPVAESDGDYPRVQRRWLKGYRFNPAFPNAPFGGYFYNLWKQ